jgi:hypothetical protein
MSTSAQIAANQANAEHSTGPKTDTGKAASSVNNFRHGLAGQFMIMAGEKREEFDELFESLRAEHQPATPTEALLLEGMAQHYWLRSRALRLQHMGLQGRGSLDDQIRLMNLYMRYQATHERAFHKCLNDLLKLRAEKRRQEIGFESQRRQQEMHQARVQSVNTKTVEREIDNDIRQTIEAPLPGHVRIPFDTLKEVFRVAAYEVNRQFKNSQAA